jgi:glycosyltransferase involved in cell wall biosynthesis
MEKLVIQLAEYSAGQGDDVAVAAGPGIWEAKVQEVGATLVALPATSRASVTGTATATAVLARAIAKMRPHVVHTHNVRASVLARLALVAARRRAALVATLHGLAPADYGLAGQILRRVAPRVIACAPSVARSLAASGFPAGRIDIITNSASLRPAGAKRQEELRQLLRLGAGPLAVGIGRLTEQKNWPALIAAADLLPELSVVVAGEGPLRERLVAQAQRSGDRVRFLGRIDDIAALIGLASCVVSTSIWEGLPLALLEALSLGAPVVATAVDGVNDAFPAGAALLVPPDSPVALSEAIARIVADSQLASDLRRTALAAARAWRPEQMLARYRSAYLAALAGAATWSEESKATMAR